MNDIRCLDYNVFVALQGNVLIKYMQETAFVDGAEIKSDVLTRMLKDLDTYDNYHLAYAIKLGSVSAPDKFAKVLPRYLQHGEQSIRIAAYNGLEQLPSQCINADLIGDVRKSLELCPETKSGMAEFWRNLPQLLEGKMKLL